MSISFHPPQQDKTTAMPKFKSHKMHLISRYLVPEHRLRTENVFLVTLSLSKPRIKQTKEKRLQRICEFQ